MSNRPNDLELGWDCKYCLFLTLRTTIVPQRFYDRRMKVEQLSNEIYLFRDGQTEGPFSCHAVQTFLRQGSLYDVDLVWFEGLKEWLPIGQIPWLYAGVYTGTQEHAPREAPALAHCNRSLPERPTYVQPSRCIPSESGWWTFGRGVWAILVGFGELMVILLLLWVLPWWAVLLLIVLIFNRRNS